MPGSIPSGLHLDSTVRCTFTRSGVAEGNAARLKKTVCLKENLDVRRPTTAHAPLAVACLNLTTQLF